MEGLRCLCVHRCHGHLCAHHRPLHRGQAQGPRRGVHRLIRSQRHLRIERTCGWRQRTDTPSCDNAGCPRGHHHTERQHGIVGFGHAGRPFQLGPGQRGRHERLYLCVRQQEADGLVVRSTRRGYRLSGADVARACHHHQRPQRGRPEEIPITHHGDSLQPLRPIRNAGAALCSHGGYDRFRTGQSS